MAEDRPLCKCHGEPMLKNGIDRRKTRPYQSWRCARERREKARLYFERLEHLAYSRRLLQMRRAHAMKRQRMRAA